MSLRGGSFTSRRAGGTARAQMAHLARAERRRESTPIAGACGCGPPSPRGTMSLHDVSADASGEEGARRKLSLCAQFQFSLRANDWESTIGCHQ